MVEFDAWVKAQLKRGNSTEAVKAVLKQEGYPQSAIARVDTIRPGKLNIRNYIIIAGVLAIGLFVIWYSANAPKPAGELKPANVNQLLNGTTIETYTGILQGGRPVFGKDKSQEIGAELTVQSSGLERKFFQPIEKPVKFYTQAAGDEPVPTNEFPVVGDNVTVVYRKPAEGEAAHIESIIKHSS